MKQRRCKSCNGTGLEKETKEQAFWNKMLYGTYTGLGIKKCKRCQGRGYL